MPSFPSSGSSSFCSWEFSILLLSWERLLTLGQGMVIAVSWVLSHALVLHYWELTALVGRGVVFLPTTPFLQNPWAELDVEALQSIIFACAHHFWCWWGLERGSSVSVQAVCGLAAVCLPQALCIACSSLSAYGWHPSSFYPLPRSPALHSKPSWEPGCALAPAVPQQLSPPPHGRGVCGASPCLPAEPSSFEGVLGLFVCFGPILCPPAYHHPLDLFGNTVIGLYLLPAFCVFIMP